jgi:iron complex outermembrane receptor protein
VNPYLKPERARSIDLTWNGHITDSWAYEISTYYNRVSDAILSINIDADTVQNQNSGRVDYTGLDLGIKGSPFEMLDVGLSYGLIHADSKGKRRAKSPTCQTRRSAPG